VHALEKGDLEIMRIGIDLIPVPCEQDRSERRIDRDSVDISVDYNNVSISFGSEKYPLKCVDARTLANNDRPACQNLHPLIYNGHGDHFPHVIK
jgi:hypothetical protein